MIEIGKNAEGITASKTKIPVMSYPEEEPEDALKRLFQVCIEG